ncbi:MAG: hypothetical protein GXY36_18080 [Chloroflexi bacterium]|nr:hypothetical protein [Chloroflexota bacterium]
MRRLTLPPLPRRFDLGWIAAALLPLIGILPTLGDGVINAADGPLHVHRIRAMTILLESGNLWPRWVPYFHIGFGYPIFNYYPPGVFYLGGLLGMIGIDAQTAFALLAALAWILGSVGTYALAKRMLPAPGSLLAAMLWSYAPSRLFEVWHQGSLPQIMAAALLPWLLYGIVRVAGQPTRRNLLAAALPLAGILLTHLPIAYIAALYAGPLALIAPLWAARRRWHEFPRRFGYTAAGLLLGVALAAIYFVPMALELHHVSAASGAEDNVSYLKSNFLQPDEVFFQPRPIDLTDMSSGLPTTLGLVGGILALGGLLALLIKRRYALAALPALALAFTVFMLLPESLDVWLAIPFFRQLRAPERLLRIGAVLIALLGGASLLLLPARRRTLALIAALPVVLLSAIPLFYGNDDFIPMRDLTALDEIEFEWATYVWGTTSYDEFDPVWGESIPRPGEVPEPELYRTDPLRLVAYRLDLIRHPDELQAEELSTDTIRITTTAARPVRFHQYYFPGWEATLDGEPVEVYAEDEMGLLTVDVPAGEHVVRLRYAGTTAQQVGAAVTLLAIAAAAALVITDRASRPAPAITPPERDRPRSLNLRPAAIIGLTAIVFAALNAAYITPKTNWFRRQSPSNDPVYMQQPVHQPFGDAFELLGYTLHQDSVRPGGWLTVTLYWRPLRPLDARYHPRVQLVNLGVSEAWANNEPFFPGGSHTVGYTPDRFTSDIHTMQIRDSAPPHLGRISVQMIHSESGEVLRLPDGADRLLLDPLIRVRGGGPDVANALDYRLGDAVELRCASVEPQGDQLSITLYWRVRERVDRDLTVMVHGLDAAGNLIEQNDRPPLGPDYPAPFWQSGQTLVDRHTLPANPDLDAIAIGLYSAEGRLRVTHNGDAVPDDRILLPIEARTCTGD